MDTKHKLIHPLAHRMRIPLCIRVLLVPYNILPSLVLNMSVFICMPLHWGHVSIETLVVRSRYLIVWFGPLSYLYWETYFLHWYWLEWMSWHQMLYIWLLCVSWRQPYLLVLKVLQILLLDLVGSIISLSLRLLWYIMIMLMSLFYLIILCSISAQNIWDGYSVCSGKSSMWSNTSSSCSFSPPDRWHHQRPILSSFLWFLDQSKRSWTSHSQVPTQTVRVW